MRRGAAAKRVVRRPTPPGWALIVLLLAGCGEGRDAGAGGTPEAGTGPDWQVELLTRIGSVDGPDDALGRVGQVLIGRDTTLVVSQPLDRQLLVYDGGGALVRRIGRQGEGPGEFGAIRAIGLVGDTLFVSDHALGRLSYLTREGDFVGSRRWPGEVFSIADDYFFTLTPPQALLGDGTALVEPSMGLTPTTAMGPGVNEAVYRTPYLRTDVDGGVIDTVAWRVSTGMSLGVTKDGETHFYPDPFPDAPLVRILPDGSGLAVVDRATSDDGPPTYGVAKIAPAGDTVFVRTFEFAPVPPSEAHLQRVFEDVVAFGLEMNPEAPDTDEVRRAFGAAGHIPRHLVPVTGLAAGQDGSIWIRREAEADAVEVTWEVLHPDDGSVEGRVSLPAGETVADARDDLVAVTGTGALDVPTVSLYRIRR